jgi:hypothetical protein
LARRVTATTASLYAVLPGLPIHKFLNISDYQSSILYQTLLKILIHKEVPQRPGRCEPRVRKRRPKAYPLMRKSRKQYHVDLKAA